MKLIRSLSIKVFLSEGSLKMPYRYRYEDTIPSFNMQARKNLQAIESIRSLTNSFVGTS